MAKRKSAEEKEAERIAKLCRCHAACTIPKADPESLVEHRTTQTWCGCKDFEYRGGSYRDEKGQVCRHIHQARVIGYQAPANTPLGQFQAANPLGTSEQAQSLIDRLCGPARKPTEPTQKPFAKLLGEKPLPADVEAIINKPLPPRRGLRITGR